MIDPNNFLKNHQTTEKSTSERNNSDHFIYKISLSPVNYDLLN